MFGKKGHRRAPGLSLKDSGLDHSQGPGHTAPPYQTSRTQGRKSPRQGLEQGWDLKSTHQGRPQIVSAGSHPWGPFFPTGAWGPWPSPIFPSLHKAPMWTHPLSQLRV